MTKRPYLLLLSIILSSTLLFFFIYQIYLAKHENLKSAEPDISISHSAYSYKEKNFLVKYFDTDIDKVKISFSFLFNSYQNWDNLFEILSEGDKRGLRMEFDINNNLSLVVGGGKDIAGTLIQKDIQLNEKYNIYLEYLKGKIKLKINDKEVEVNQYQKKLNLNKMTVGYGFNEDRFFNGEIEKFDAHFFEKKIATKEDLLILIILLITAPFYIYIIRNFVSFFEENDFSIKISNKYLIVILLFLLLFILLMIYPLKAVNSFYDYKTKVHEVADFNLKVFKFFLLNEIKKDYYKNFNFSTLDKSNLDLPEFSITINNRNYSKLNSNLPESGYEKFYGGYIKINDGKPIKMSMRYRGDSLFHWYFKQKSLRVKLRKGNLYNMERKFNLINPMLLTGFRDIANYRLSSELGIISPDQYPVKVFINGEYYGVYLYLSQVDESLLRKHKVMPGSIYYGDLGAPKSEKGFSSLWQDAKYWEKKASRNIEQKKFRDDINFFIKKINNSSELEFYDFFNKYIDKNTFYNFISLDRITGTQHHDASHNHKIYFDPYKGKFQPIQWDMRFWGPFEAYLNKENIIYKDTSYNPFVHRINNNPILSHELDKATYEMYQSNIENRLYKIYKNNVIKAENALKADKFKDTAVYDVAKNANMIANFAYNIPYKYEDQLNEMKKDKIILKERKKELHSFFKDTKLRLSSKIKSNKRILKYYISGNSAVKIDFSNLKSDVFRVFKNNNTLLNRKEDIIYPGKIEEKVFSTTDSSIFHDPVFARGDKKVINASEEYVFLIDSNSSLNDITYKNAITKEEINLEIVDSFKKNAMSIHPWGLLENYTTEVILEGDIHVSKDIFFEKYEEIIIKPNTRFIMYPNKSIYFFGKVIANGTVDFPIKFIPKDNLKPWGTVVLQGKETSGSYFNNVEFSGGSVSNNSLIYYTAQFNIHDSDNFTIKNSIFDTNYIGDDNVHIAYANGKIESSIFSNSKSDALDIDIADVHVSNNIFINSGNDGVDIMTTNLIASDNIFINAGDKGISIGEWSEAIIKDSIIYQAYTGLAVKDKSKATLQDVIVVNSESEAILAYNKNFKYDEGGFIKGKNIFIVGNEKINFDKKSIINIKRNNNPLIKKYGWYKNIFNLPEDKRNELLNLEKR